MCNHKCPAKTLWITAVMAFCLYSCDGSEIHVYTIDHNPNPIGKCDPGFINVGNDCLKIICEPDKKSCCDSIILDCESIDIMVCNQLGTSFDIIPCDADNPELVAACPSKCLPTHCTNSMEFDPETKQCVYPDPPVTEIICANLPGTSFCCDSNISGCEPEGGLVICDEEGTHYELIPCSNLTPEQSNVCRHVCKPECNENFEYDPDTGVCVASCPENYDYSPELNKCIPVCPENYEYNSEKDKCIPICPENYQYNSTTDSCEFVDNDTCIKFKDSAFEEFVYLKSGWDTNHDNCLTKDEANAVQTLKHDSFSDNSLNGYPGIKTLDDLNSFPNLFAFDTYAIRGCLSLDTVTLKYVTSFHVYSLLDNTNIETLKLPRATSFNYYFADNMPKLKHLFLTAPGDFDVVNYSFIGLTCDISYTDWMSIWDNANAEVTLYLNRDKLNTATPKIVTSTRWG